MYVRNLLHSGDFAVPCPMGLPVVLNYDNRGVLCKVLLGTDKDTAKSAPGYMLPCIVEEGVAPKSLVSETGIAWIYGFLYSSDKLFKGEGSLPDAGFDFWLAQFKEDPTQFKFGATHAVTGSVAFATPSAVRTWLAVNHFVPLTGWLIPYKFDKASLEKLFNTRMLSFKYPYIGGYAIYHKGEYSYASSAMSQLVVKSITRRMLESGDIVVDIEGQAHKITVNYSEAVSLGVSVGSCLLIDSEKKVIFSSNSGPGSVPSEFVCEVCGRKIVCNGEKGPVRCGDPHCLSKAYPEVLQFLKVFKLPELSYVKYREHVAAHDILSVSDLLDLPEYKEMDITCTLLQILRAVIPDTVVRDVSFLTQLINACRGNVSTLRYYLAHPDDLNRELHVFNPEYPKLRQWLADPFNLSTLDCMFDHPKVSVTTATKAFDGPQIMRGRKLYLTGKFNHGPKDLITAIFASYGAEVVPSFDETVSLVVVGDIKEDIDGGAIQWARRNDVPVKDEHELFDLYEIDKDLASNLVYI